VITATFFDMAPKPLDIGVFIPIGNDGWLISTTAPRFMPTFDLNKEIVLKAESYGFDFALSMIKLRGFGGKTEHWDHNLESFTLMVQFLFLPLQLLNSRWAH
jgi:pyrimidine oxygenase